MRREAFRQQIDEGAHGRRDVMTMRIQRVDRKFDRRQVRQHTHKQPGPQSKKGARGIPFSEVLCLNRPP